MRTRKKTFPTILPLRIPEQYTPCSERFSSGQGVFFGIELEKPA